MAFDVAVAPFGVAGSLRLSAKDNFVCWTAFDSVSFDGFVLTVQIYWMSIDLTIKQNTLNHIEVKVVCI